MGINTSCIVIIFQMNFFKFSSINRFNNAFQVAMIRKLGLKRYNKKVTTTYYLSATIEFLILN